MPDILRRNPRRSWWGAFGVLYIIAGQMEQTKFIHMWVGENLATVVMFLTVAVIFCYQTTQDHTRNDEKVQGEMKEVKATLHTQSRGIKYLMRKAGGDDAENEIKLLFGEKE